MALQSSCVLRAHLELRQMDVADILVKARQLAEARSCDLCSLHMVVLVDLLTQAEMQGQGRHDK